MVDLDRGGTTARDRASYIGLCPQALSAATLFEFIFGVHLRFGRIW